MGMEPAIGHWEAALLALIFLALAAALFLVVAILELVVYRVAVSWQRRRGE